MWGCVYARTSAIHRRTQGATATSPAASLDAGLPAGVFQIVQGGQPVVEALCDHPEIRALAFVGSTRVAERRMVEVEEREGVVCEPIRNRG